MTDYTRLRQLAENATPGPWGHERSDNSYDWNAFVYTELGGGRTVAGDASDGDAEFIAAANPDTIRNLLEDLRLSREELVAEKHKCLEYSKENAALRRGQGGKPESPCA